MKTFNGQCPKCGGEVELVGVEDQGDCATVLYDCQDCKDRIVVSYSGGIVVD